MARVIKISDKVAVRPPKNALVQVEVQEVDNFG